MAVEAPHEQNDASTVEAWRLQQLLDAGWKRHRAELLAGRVDIDLHTAVQLVTSGCPQKLGLKILL